MSFGGKRKGEEKRGANVKAKGRKGKDWLTLRLLILSRI
jgi:hypothetical protein